MIFFATKYVDSQSIDFTGQLVEQVMTKCWIYGGDIE